MASHNKSPFWQRVLHSGSWTLAGYAVSQALRLGGNLILTRLLFPEAFGMMAIVMVACYGVTMFVDMGIAQSIVQNKRGDDPAFINTAWSIQIILGVLIFAGMSALAWPMAIFYDAPELAAILPVIGVSAIINGFNSTKLYTAQRNLEAKRVTLIDIGTYALGLLLTIFLAWLMRSVWSLVWGHVISNALKMAATHMFLHGMRNRFAWERDAAKQLVRFGRWIMWSSVLTFLSVEGGRLLISALLDWRQLALFTLANTMNLMFWQAIQQLAGKVFFPAYAEVYRNDPKQLPSVMRKARLAVTVPSWCTSVLFVFFGSWVMGVLYDERYHGSGGMLQLLAAGSLMGCVWGSYTGALLAIGKVATMTALTAIQIVFQIGGMALGYRYWGGAGILIGLAAAAWVMYFAQAYVMRLNGLLQLRFDLAFLSASTLVIILAWPRLVSSVAAF
jgi:O-antigen/teichoic acid export membrane protein